MRFRTIVLAVFVAGFVAVTAPLFAQNRASITGTVRDATGAVLPNAEVTVTDTATGVSLKATTNSGGDYLVAALPASKYNLKVTATGFKTFEATGIIIPVGEKARVDATLEVGQITSEIRWRVRRWPKWRPSLLNFRRWSPERRSASLCLTAAISRN